MRHRETKREAPAGPQAPGTGPVGGSVGPLNTAGPAVWLHLDLALCHLLNPTQLQEWLNAPSLGKPSLIHLPQHTPHGPLMSLLTPLWRLAC